MQTPPEAAPWPGAPRSLGRILPSPCHLPQLRRFLFRCRQQIFLERAPEFTLCWSLGFSRTLAYPKYFSFLVSVCLRIDPISRISISTELSASGLMKARFEACAATSETRAAAAPCCLLARAVHIAVYTFWFCRVLLDARRDCFSSQAMVQGLESWCWRSHPERDVRPSSGGPSKGQFVLLSDTGCPQEQCNLFLDAKSILLLQR